MRARQEKLENLRTGEISEFRVHYFKASLRAKSLLGISVFIHIEIRTNYHDSHFAFTLALIETGGNWDMVDYIAMQIKDCLPTSRKDG